MVNNSRVSSEEMKSHVSSKQARSQDAEAFLLRLDRQVNESRRKLEYKAAKQEYDAKVSKRECPKCGRQQSYDEVLKKKSRCSSCRKSYVFPVVWKDVRESFMQRNVDAEPRRSDAFHQNCHEKVHKRGHSGKKPKVIWNAVREEFLKRMEKASLSRSGKHHNGPGEEEADLFKPTRKVFRGAKKSTAHRMNYSMYVEGCAASSLPVNVDKVLGFDARPEPVDTNYCNGIEDVSEEWKQSRDLVLARLARNSTC